MPLFPGHDGVRLAYHELGTGRPLVLLHGISGSASLWQQNGTAAAIAAAGHRVIMPDFRGHGQSAKPHETEAYPPDVLTDDGLALIEHLGLDDYDLGGYSLGGRIVVRMLVRGATPGRAIVGGQGMREVLGIGGGAGNFLRRIHAGRGTFEPDSPEGRAEAWYDSNGEDLEALMLVLDSIVATGADTLGGIGVPTLVIVGTDDERAASADQLVEALPQGKLATVPGNHSTAIAAPEFLSTIVDFLAR